MGISQEGDTLEPDAVEPAVKIDRARSARRIEEVLDEVSRPRYTRSPTAICRYAFTPEYTNTVGYFATALEELGYETQEDPVGNFIARNRPDGEPTYGVGSHCDSNRNGGRYDGTLGVVAALELCRLDSELNLGLPLQVVVPVEEEASGFGHAMLGSAIMAQAVEEVDLRELRAIDDGKSFWSHAEAAGFEPDRWRECRAPLEQMLGWLELHIEQGRVLQDAEVPIGIVDRIVGIVHADVTIHGSADHAGATPMGIRRDAGIEAARLALEITELARASRSGVVATVGELDLDPGLINVVPGSARLSLDVRGPDGVEVDEVLDKALANAQASAAALGMRVEHSERSRVAPTPMDGRVVDALEGAAQRLSIPHLTMRSGACHDTMHIARHVSAAMVFVPCRDGISHSPREYADPADAALGAEIMLNALLSLASSEPMNDRK
ncbi:MAG: Zn-dependent hydrolase [Solirubrobacterales bacterium]